jgi:hypothetical protein
MTSILLILSLISSSFYHAVQDPDPEKAKFRDKLYVIDLVKCQPLSKRYGWDLGYDNIEVKGIEQNRCVIRHVTDWEGKYTVSECRVKPSLKRLAIIKGPLAEAALDLDYRKYCKVVKTGRQFPGDPDPQ